VLIILNCENSIKHLFIYFSLTQYTFQFNTNETLQKSNDFFFTKKAEFVAFGYNGPPLTLSAGGAIIPSITQKKFLR